MFDTRCQPEYDPHQVVLWDVRSGQFDIQGKETTRTELRLVRNPARPGTTRSIAIRHLFRNCSKQTIVPGLRRSMPTMSASASRGAPERRVCTAISATRSWIAPSPWNAPVAVGVFASVAPADAAVERKAAVTETSTLYPTTRAERGTSDGAPCLHDSVSVRPPGPVSDAMDHPGSAPLLTIIRPARPEPDETARQF